MLVVDTGVDAASQCLLSIPGFFANHSWAGIMGSWAAGLGYSAWLLGLGYLDRSRQIGRLELNSPNRLIRHY